MLVMTLHQNAINIGNFCVQVNQMPKFVIVTTILEQFTFTTPFKLYPIVTDISPSFTYYFTDLLRISLTQGINYLHLMSILHCLQSKTKVKSASPSLQLTLLSKRVWLEAYSRLDDELT